MSAALVKALNTPGVPYASRDVLQDPELRQGIKECSNWPTVSQVYLDGRSVGRCDIVTEMHAIGGRAKLVK